MTVDPTLEREELHSQCRVRSFLNFGYSIDNACAVFVFILTRMVHDRLRQALQALHSHLT